MSGSLEGVRVLELGGKGPTPFAGMLLADMGAEVVVIERFTSTGDEHVRGKSRLRLDLKDAAASAALRGSFGDFDVVIEGFRPGAAERLGLGPDDALAANPRIVYGRMTGYGQGNSYSQVAGHDVNFIAMSSALAHIGPADRPPVIPLNLVGDFGGGGMLLVVGVLGALVERAASGRGQVVDAAMTDGSALLMASAFEQHATGSWTNDRAANYTDGGAPFYGVYETADGRYVSVGALDKGHYSALLGVLGIDPAPDQHDRAGWPALRLQFERIIASHDRDHWIAAFAGIDASFAPVLTMDDAPGHPYHRERGTFATIDGHVQPAAAPRFSRTPSSSGGRAPKPALEVLTAMGLTDAAAADLVARGVAG